MVRRRKMERKIATAAAVLLTVVLVLLALTPLTPAGGTFSEGASTSTPTPDEERWVFVGPSNNPIRLDKQSSHFQELCLTFCTREQYKQLTGHKLVYERQESKEIAPLFHEEELEQTPIFLERLHSEYQNKFGDESLPEEVRWEDYFPPPGRQLAADCGAWSLGYGGCFAQKKGKTAVWAPSGWEPQWYYSPKFASSLAGHADCMTPMLSGFSNWQQKGFLTLDRLPYDGSCDWTPTEEDLFYAYPLRIASHGLIFARTENTEVGTTDDVRRAIALGRINTLSFGPRDRTAPNHAVAIGGYTSDGIHCLDEQGPEWGENGWVWFSWAQLLGEESVGAPYFSTPKIIGAVIRSAEDWDGECLPEEVGADYRGICENPCCGYDFDGSGTIDIGDIMTVAACWRSTEPECTPYDLDGDGRITVVDIMKVVACWGIQCPQ